MNRMSFFLFISLCFTFAMSCQHSPSSFPDNPDPFQPVDTTSILDTTTVSSTLSMSVRNSGKGYFIDCRYGKQKLRFIDPSQPIVFELDDIEYHFSYDSCYVRSDSIIASAVINTSKGSIFKVDDSYKISEDNNSLILSRNVSVLEPGGENCFNSVFGFLFSGSGTSIFDRYELFIPGKIYRQQYLGISPVPGSTPKPTDSDHVFRAEISTIPMAFMRSIEGGRTVSIIHTDLLGTTVLSDSRGVRINPYYQYGSFGARLVDGNVRFQFCYPGSEYSTRGTGGYRSHPVVKGLMHSYRLEISLSDESSYGDAVQRYWQRAFDIYDPEIVPADQKKVYEGEITTLKHYYQATPERGGVFDVPGIPFSVMLEPPYAAKGTAYQLGFTGMITTLGHALFRYGVENSQQEWIDKGADILDFWASSCETDLGLPRVQYNPGENGNAGRWVIKSNMRSISDGMEGLLLAYNYARKNGYSKPQWLNACNRYAYWLSSNQNEDGSWFFSYDHTRIENGKHPVTNDSKYQTPCPLKFLLGLYLTTKDSSIKTTIDKAAQFCWSKIHSEYAYMHCIPSAMDGIGTIDKESGQNAMYSFSLLYSLTGDKKWLDAAVQAAVDVGTWTFMYDLPVESDAVGPFVFPKNASTVGQSKISLGTNGADLGVSWNSFDYYRIYLWTGNERFWRLAHICAENTVQSMNLNGDIYPGGMPGLQIEAYRITVPRRSSAVLTTTCWEYASFLDPMMQFYDCFGYYDINEVDSLPLEERKRLNDLYLK